MAGFGLGIRYLNGWAMAAADGAKKEIAEWPPHPNRVFMALAAAWFETGQDPEEGEALRWLEQQPPPALSVSEAERRVASTGDRPVVTYVPVNDTTRGRLPSSPRDLKKLREAGLALLPEHRSRQPRSFPVALPHSDCAYLVWPEACPPAHRLPLEALAGKVTHVGHSASLTQMWLEDEPPAPNLIPTAGLAKHRLRVPGPGRLADLEARANHAAVLAYSDLSRRIDQARGKQKRALQAERAERFGDVQPVVRRPEPSLWQAYASPPSAPAAPVRHTVFDPAFVVLTLSGHRLSLGSTLKLTEALRGAIQKFCPDPVPEWVSGHAPGGKASDRPHLALVPLAFVGSEHADGRLLGAGLMLPRGVDEQDVARCLEPLLYDNVVQPRTITLYDGQWLECQAIIEQRESPPRNLRPETWTHPSAAWASVTPVALDRHFDGRNKWERAAESLKDGCQRIGLPRPREALLHPVSMVEGVPHAREFPSWVRKSDGGRIHHGHAVLLFDEPVQGPILIGAGRYRGYGFFRPLGEDRHA